jgi:2-phosphoglycerate kinase
MSERRHVTPLPLGGEIPFSKGLMARALVVTGLDTERAYLIAHRVDRDLAERRALSLDLERLAELAAEVIGEESAETTVRRLKRLDALQRLDEPLLLLVGGATGTGKSTIATEAAHRLGSTRVTSTDFIRQTMRAFFSEEFMPSVHYSSFEARLALTRAEEEESGDAAILGFLDQTRNVLVGAHAALDRAATEHWSMVLEGVHLVPGMISTEFPGAFVVQCVVAIEDENLHRSHFWVREYATEGLRPLEKYLDLLPQIRQIQDYLVERAHRYDVPVIVNHSLDRAIGDVMDLVLRRADQLVAAG